MCTSVRLANAIKFIASMHPESQVTAIQFEDGSGQTFNYQLNNSGNWLFLDARGFGTNSISELFYSIVHSSGSKQEYFKRVLLDVWAINYDNLCVSAS